MSSTKEALQAAIESKRNAEKEISSFIIEKLRSLADETGLSIKDVEVDVLTVEIERIDQDERETVIGGVKTVINYDF
ncbi:hypothetical protein [Pseudomonas viridiflava]|uniref:hypothetical protein n=1 Tax=Pseudomonas viridiflava TaxID=33069 RepID=UPI001C3157D5|nr:hypothetical protein [Pseudomonas viridiflava]QXG49203.1 hypothetical protein KTT57_09375 [Pseudomonas viridiflava]